MEEDRPDGDIVIGILAKPEAIRTLQDVKRYIDKETKEAEVRYAETIQDTKQAVHEEFYRDELSELQDAQKGLEGKEPQNTIDYFTKQINTLESVSDNLTEVPRQYADIKISFFKQAIRLIKNDVELKKIFRGQ